MASLFDPPTENANPVILAVDKSRSKKKQALIWSETGLAAISAADSTSTNNNNNIGNNSTVVRTAEDRAILQALTDAAAASHGQGVSLLRNIGLVIPTNRKDLPFAQNHSPPPLFTYSTATTTAAAAAPQSRNAKQAASPPQPPQPSQRDKVDADEIFEIIRNIQDPEHPVTLEQLGVVSREQIEVFDILDIPPEERRPDDGACSTCNVRFTPTIPHCSMATQIGLSIIVKLNRSLPSRFKTTVRIEPGMHASEDATNKQLADKERVCAALENKHLLGIVNKCIINGMTGNMS
jgi:metal-sulfur cluster biosynthetic enzyme